MTKNILIKIKTLKESVILLLRVKNHEKLNDTDTKKGKKIMRDLNLILERFEDIEKAIGTLNQRAVVYKGKLESFSNRVNFRKNNVCFELYRSKFYRALADDQKVEYTITDEEIKSYWETMLN